MNWFLFGLFIGYIFIARLYFKEKSAEREKEIQKLPHLVGHCHDVAACYIKFPGATKLEIVSYEKRPREYYDIFSKKIVRRKA